MKESPAIGAKLLIGLNKHHSEIGLSLSEAPNNTASPISVKGYHLRHLLDEQPAVSFRKDSDRSAKRLIAPQCIWIGVIPFDISPNIA